MRYRQVLRRIAHSPGFTAIAVLTMALGIGANSAIFSVLEGVLLKPLPYPHPEELVSVWHSAKGINLGELEMAPFLYFTYREQNRTLRDIGMWDTESGSVTGLAEPEQVGILLVTDATLSLLGISPALGRWFSRSDDSPGTPETVMLTYGYWQSRFGGDRSVIGRRLMVNGRAREIIGVMPARFHFLDYHPALILPLRFDRSRVFLGNFSYQALARLRPGVSLSQANADATHMIPIGLDSFPPPPGYSKKMIEDARLAPNLRPLKQDVIGSIADTLWLVMGTIGMVLLIACANVANLLLVRADARQRELAIRTALGAGWRTIAAELMAESLTLGVLGGLAGLGLAYCALRLLVRMGPASLPRLGEIGIDLWVLLFTLGVSLAAGLLFGAIPVWKYAGAQVAAALHGGGRTSSQSRERHRSRNVLVVVQVALALVLLVSSGLMIRSFQALRHVRPGFTHPEWVETTHISIPETQVKDATAVVRMEQDILEKVAAIPGVESAGLASTIPLHGSGWEDPIFPEGRDYTEGQVPPLRHYRFVSPGALDATGTRLVAGREFTWNDIYAKRPIAMVSENLAREIWRTPQAAIGKRLRATPKNPWHEIVGVVEDVRYDGLDKAFSSTAYWPILIEQFEDQPVFVWRSIFYVIRSRRTGGEGFLNELQRAVWSVNPNLPLADVQSLRRIYNKSIARTSFTLVMLSLAGGMALLLGMVGIYGVISYSVSQRTREIGIRMALGAQRGELTRLFLRDGLRLALIGVACGLAAAAILMRLMAKLLFEVKPVDPATYAAMSACLVAAALAASYLPTLRITLIHPVNALRAE
jgi:predicted permease